MVEKEQLVAMVQGMQAGDEAATALMYETFQEDFYYFILKTVNNDRELAEDLVQDTFVEILESIHKLEEPVAFVTWAKQIAYHRCTGYFRKKKELLLDENEDGTTAFDIQVEENAEFIPDEALDNKELKQTIMAMINELPEEQRSALLLRYFNEISVKEIAQIQNVSEGTIKSRLNYARKSIKQAVETYEKKNGVKLHCVGVLPLLLWVFREYRVANKLSMATGTAVQSFVLAEETAVVAGVAATGGAAATTAAATTTAATTTATAATTTAATTAATVAGKAAVGAGIKAAATALSTKIIAGVVAAAVVVGGTTAGISVAKKNNAPQQPTQETAIVEMVEETEATEEVMLEAIAEETVAQEIVETTEPTETPGEKVTETTKPTETTEPTEVTKPTETTNSTEPTEVPTKAPTEETIETPTESNVCEHQWDVDNANEGRILYRCVLCDAVKDEVDPNYEPTESPADPDNCEHQWVCNGEGETGTFLYECVACGAMYVEYRCPHEFCTQEQLTDPNDGSTYIRYTCISCGYTY